MLGYYLAGYMYLAGMLMMYSMLTFHEGELSNQQRIELVIWPAAVAIGMVIFQYKLLKLVASCFISTLTKKH